MDDELFAVFETNGVHTNGSAQNEVSRKRSLPKGESGEGKQDFTAQSSKKARLISPTTVHVDTKSKSATVRADEFEQETQQQLVSGKGLTGSTETGGNIVLSHQVS